MPIFNVQSASHSVHQPTLDIKQFKLHAKLSKSAAAIILSCCAVNVIADGNNKFKLASGKDVLSIFNIETSQLISSTASSSVTKGSTAGSDRTSPTKITSLANGRALALYFTKDPGDSAYKRTIGLFSFDAKKVLAQQDSISFSTDVGHFTGIHINASKNLALVETNNPYYHKYNSRLDEASNDNEYVYLISTASDKLKQIRRVKGSEAQWLSKEHFSVFNGARNKLSTYHVDSATPLNTVSFEQKAVTGNVASPGLFNMGSIMLPQAKGTKDSARTVQRHVVTAINKVFRSSKDSTELNRTVTLSTLMLTDKGLVKTAEQTILSEAASAKISEIEQAIAQHPNNPVEARKAALQVVPSLYEHYADHIVDPLLSIHGGYRVFSKPTYVYHNLRSYALGDYIALRRGKFGASYLYNTLTGQFEQKIELNDIQHVQPLENGNWHILSASDKMPGNSLPGNKTNYISRIMSHDLSNTISEKTLLLNIPHEAGQRYKNLTPYGLAATYYDEANKKLYFRTQLNEKEQAIVDLAQHSISANSITPPPYSMDQSDVYTTSPKTSVMSLPLVNVPYMVDSNTNLYANNDFVFMPSGTSTYSVDVLSNDTGEGVKLMSAEYKSTPLLIKDGKVMINPDSKFPAVDSAKRTFTYTIADKFGNQSTGFATVIPDRSTTHTDASIPFALDYTLATTGDTLSINLKQDLIAKGVKLDGFTCTNEILTPSMFGFNGMGQREGSIDQAMVYRPHPDNSGVDKYWYKLACYKTTANDDIRLSQIGSIEVKVDTIDKGPAPTAVIDRTSVTLGNSVKIDVLNNDTGEIASIDSIDTTSTAGSVKLEGNYIVYTADNGNAGMDIFTYTIKDKFGRTSTAKVAVNVTTTPTVSLLYAAEDKVTVFSGQSIVINALSNDSGNGKRIIGVKAAEHGTVSDSWKTKQVIEYTAASAGADADEFWYGITDASNQAQSWTKVSITVKHKPNSGAPVAHPDSATTESAAVTIDVTANDEGLPVTVDYVDEAQHGTVSIESNALTYTPNNGFKGLDSFWYAISNAAGKVSWAEVTVSVGSASITPIVVREDKAFTTAGVAVMIDPLANDDGDQLRITSVDEADDGKAQLVNNQIRYTPNSKFIGTESLWIEVTDGFNNSKWSEMIIQVTENPDILRAKPDHKQLQMGESISVDVLANDTGIDLALEDESGSWLGETRIVDGQLVFTAHNGMSGQDKIWYGISDQTGEWVWSYLEVTVIGDAAEVKTTANVDEITLKEGQSKTVAVLNNDTGEDLRLEEVNESWLGEVERYGDTVTFTASNEAGTDKIWYGISDASGEWAWSHILVTVTK